MLYVLLKTIQYWCQNNAADSALKKWYFHISTSPFSSFSLNQQDYDSVQWWANPAHKQNFLAPLQKLKLLLITFTQVYCRYKCKSKAVNLNNHDLVISNNNQCPKLCHCACN